MLGALLSETDENVCFVGIDECRYSIKWEHRLFNEQFANILPTKWVRNMSFASHLPSVLGELQIKDAERSKYTFHAQTICNELMRSLQQTDKAFKKAFDGLSLTGSYLDRLKLKTPDEFDLHMKLKLPFHIIPKRDILRPGFVFLFTSDAIDHPLVENSYVNHKRLQSWLRDGFTHVLLHECKTINVDVPAFEFSYKDWPLDDPPVTPQVRRDWPWFAIPQTKAPSDDRSFMVCAPHWEREMMTNKYNLKNTLRLMKAMRDVHKDQLPHLTSYMLKTVILLELSNATDNLWQQNEGKTLVLMWSKLVQYFKKATLPYFLAPNCNHFDRMNVTDFNECRQKVDQLLTRLTSLANSPSTRKAVRKLFID
ncbi:uncharacterized protein Dmoj_GI13277, isoform B [Drosophila mojavensis]|uniref:Uncharacterized protein, isoform B n=1 Tax=Drosophila mojavensis TaxID=7230 RepID=A0A0Q9XQ10_DROMO|nr:uncharacterized protein Dmoj_GI13277, isoform B [Drosophila mojavensis]